MALPAAPNFRQIAVQAARRYGLNPQIFLRQINQESGFNPNARSGAGAVGIAQIVPKYHPGVNPLDPVASLNWAAKYMAGLVHQYGGYAQALSVYNSGQPNTYRDPHFAGGQTFNYVKDILGGSNVPVSASVPEPVSSRPLPASVMAPPRPQPRPDLTNLFNLGNQMFDLAPLPAGALAPLPPAQGLQGRAGVAPRPAMNRPVTATPAPPKHGSTLNFIEHFAAPYGLTITSTTGGKHAPHSYHYQGRAVDFGGDPARMAALAQAALKHPQDFREMFYAGPGSPGFFIKNGRVYPNSQLDPGLAAEHRDHVHLAS